MKRLSVICVCAVTLWASCDWDVGIRGNGHIVTVEKPVGAFSMINSRGALRIDWHSGAPSLAITTDENLVQYFEVSVNGDRLDLKMRQRVRPTHGIKIVLSSQSLAGADLSGAADLIAHALSGGSFAIQSKGVASLVLDGAVDQLLADLTGASELKAKNLQARVVEISTTGAADAWVNASEKLRVAITGAGEVTYSGNPQTVERHVTGAGTIRHKD